MTLSIFVGTSLDGFIARPDGALDFLPAGGGEPHGYEEFIAGVDALVIGHKTFETVLAFAEWPYGDKRVVVLSSRPLDFATLRGGRVEQMSGAPAEIAAKLAASGAQNLYIDGGRTIQGFLRAGLIERLIVTRVPVLIGAGIPLFGSLPQDVRLEHVSTRAFKSGLVQSEYRVLQSAAGPLAQAQPPPQALIAVHPVLMCRDVAAALVFYARLGFATAFKDRDASPQYAVIRRDDVELHLQWADATQFLPPRDRPVYRFQVADVDALFTEFAGSLDNVELRKTTSPWATPSDTPWGTREFHLQDPDGNGLQFYRAQPNHG